MIKINLPLPPTTNNLFCTGRNGRRFTNPIYAQWQWAAAAALQEQKPIEGVKGPFRFWLTVPVDMRGDVDNRLKAAIDFCVAHAITPDDKHAQSVKAERGAVEPGRCLIEIEAAA